MNEVDIVAKLSGQQVLFLITTDTTKGKAAFVGVIEPMEELVDLKLLNKVEFIEGKFEFIRYELTDLGRDVIKMATALSKF